MKLKTCGKCRAIKSASEFYTRGGANPPADGLAGWCKECRKSDERRRRQDPVLIAVYRKRYETDLKFRSRELLRVIRKRATADGLPFDLDAEWLEKRIEDQCELTGLPFDLSVSGLKRAGPRSPSVDRIAPGGGYTKANCRVVLYAINVAMSDLTLDGFLPIARAFVHRADRKKSGAA